MPSPTPATHHYELIAQISKTKGLDGQLIAQEMGGLSILRPGLEVWVVPPTLRGIRHTRVASVQRDKHKQGVVLYLEDVDDRTKASELPGRYLLAHMPEEGVRPSWTLSSSSEDGSCLDDEYDDPQEQYDAEDDEGYWPEEAADEDVGTVVFRDITNGDLGILTHVKQGPAYDIWVIEGPHGILEIPAVEEYVAEEGDDLLVLDLPKGFIEITSFSDAKKTRTSKTDAAHKLPEEE